MKNRSDRWDINRPRPRHEDKYIECKVCLSVMMAKCFKQLQGNI